LEIVISDVVWHVVIQGRSTELVLEQIYSSNPANSVNVSTHCEMLPESKFNALLTCLIQEENEGRLAEPSAIGDTFEER